MDNKLIISVVIPVYNAQGVVRRAVESILPQMNGRVELILVDDGSTDNSGAVCDEYSKNHEQVKVVHKVNGGLSSARNAGMRAAEGEYIVFLDADDYLTRNACEELEKVIREHHPDCIDFGWNYVNGAGEITPNLHKVPKNVLLGNDVLRDMILPPLLHLNQDDEHFIYDFACMKVFRRRIIEENAVSFNEKQRIWEDRPFVCHYLKYCRNYYSMDRCLYYYVFTEGSLGQRYSLDFFRIMLTSFRFYRKLYADEFDFDTPFVNHYWCHAIENMIYRSLEQKQNRDAITENILSTLRDAQVVHWYSECPPQDAFEKKVWGLVVAGEVEAALRLYKKKASQKRGQKALRNCGIRIKNGLKSVIRKLLGK